MQALSYIEGLSRFEKIADIGCGRGEQTVVLYEATHAKIIAVDFINEYVAYLQDEVRIQELDNRISAIQAQPDNLPFFNDELDMIWAESIASIIGFENALRSWGSYLRKDGYIGLCSYCWLTKQPPQNVSDFWKDSGKEICTISSRISKFQEMGFIPVAHFIMQDECWWNYYCSLEENFPKFLQAHPNNPDAEELIHNIDKEIDLYEKYGEHYGYVFFIGKKVS